MSLRQSLILPIHLVLPASLVIRVLRSNPTSIQYTPRLFANGLIWSVVDGLGERQVGSSSEYIHCTLSIPSTPRLDVATTHSHVSPWQVTVAFNIYEHWKLSCPHSVTTITRVLLSAVLRLLKLFGRLTSIDPCIYAIQVATQRSPSSGLGRGQWPFTLLNGQPSYSYAIPPFVSCLLRPALPSMLMFSHTCATGGILYFLECGNLRGTT